MFFTMATDEALNFKIKAYSTEAELLADTPVENTIGVEANGFDSYVISATEPENPTAGMLWIEIDADSPVKFMAARKNPVFLHPIKAYIYRTPEGEMDACWDVVVSYLYQYSEWNAFGRVYLYRNKTFNNVVTEGLSGYGLGYSDDKHCAFSGKTNNYGYEMDATKSFVGTEAKNGRLVLFQGIDTDPSDGFGARWGQFDATYFKKLVFKGLFERENDDSSAIYGLWGKLETNYQSNLAASQKITENNTEPVVIDISTLEGEYYIGVGIRSTRTRIDECYLEM